MRPAYGGRGGARQRRIIMSRARTGRYRYRRDGFDGSVLEATRRPFRRPVWASIRIARRVTALV